MHYSKFILTSLTTLMIILAACTRQEDGHFQIVRVNVHEDLPADSFISGYSYIQLDSVTEPMLSEVKDIRIQDSLLFILDDAGRIFTFSTTGHHITTLDSMGLSSGQYATADAFDVTKTGIFVLSRPQKRIIKYSFDGHLESIYPVHDYYLDFRVLSDSTIILASGNCNNRMANFITMDIQSQSFTHENEPFNRTESFISDTYHPFVEQIGDTLFITNPFQTNIKVLADGKSIPFKAYKFNTKEQLPETNEDYTFEEITQMTKHKSVVRGLALHHATSEAEYLGYEMFGECGLSYLLSRTKHDGTMQNMVIMNNPDINFPYLSPPVCAQDGQLISIMPAYILLQTEKSYGLSQFTSAGLHQTDNPVIFLHQLR
ncbi:MAG: 6-bladed beta-propeller [Bacteroidaceae bacterium]